MEGVVRLAFVEVRDGAILGVGHRARFRVVWSRDPASDRPLGSPSRAPAGLRKTACGIRLYQHDRAAG